MGKALMFMIFMWMVVSVLGGVAQGSTLTTSASRLTVAIDDADVVINVASTNGFPDTGIVVIGDERIAYPSKTATTLVGIVAQPVRRGAEDTDAVAHSVGAIVRTVENSLLNQSVSYNLAIITDPAGWSAFIEVPVALLRLFATFFTLPLSFLGTDLVIITYIWSIFSIGIITSVAMAIIGGRRV